MWASRSYARSPGTVGLKSSSCPSARVFATLLSDLTSRFGPCASLSLHLHQAVKRTFTSKLSNMLGTHKKSLLGEQAFFVVRRAWSAANGVNARPKLIE